MTLQKIHHIQHIPRIKKYKFNARLYLTGRNSQLR